MTDSGFFWLLVFLLVELIISFITGALVVSLFEEIQELTRQIKKVQERLNSWTYWIKQ